jgi:hypothetical protein
MMVNPRSFELVRVAMRAAFRGRARSLRRLLAVHRAPVVV